MERAGLAYEPPGPAVLDELAPQLLAPGGRFRLREDLPPAGDVVAAVAPHLHGLPVALLDRL